MVDLLLQAAASQLLHKDDIHRRLYSFTFIDHRVRWAALQVRDHGGRRSPL